MEDVKAEIKKAIEDGADMVEAVKEFEHRA